MRVFKSKQQKEYEKSMKALNDACTVFVTNINNALAKLIIALNNANEECKKETIKRLSKTKPL